MFGGKKFPKFNGAKFYSRFRASKNFVIALVVFIGVWMGLHWMFNFDPTLGNINLILSTESSISTALLAMLIEMGAERQRHLEEIDRKQEERGRMLLRYLVTLTEANRDQMTAHVEGFEQVQEQLAELGERFTSVESVVEAIAKNFGIPFS